METATVINGASVGAPRASEGQLNPIIWFFGDRSYFGGYNIIGSLRSSLRGCTYGCSYLSGVLGRDGCSSVPESGDFFRAAKTAGEWRCSSCRLWTSQAARVLPSGERSWAKRRHEAGAVCHHVSPVRLPSLRGCLHRNPRRGRVPVDVFIRPIRLYTRLQSAGTLCCILCEFSRLDCLRGTLAVMHATGRGGLRPGRRPRVRAQSRFLCEAAVVLAPPAATRTPLGFSTPGLARPVSITWRASL